eukprot:38013-Eustigmatos_ZCMA.PRE.1
MDVVTKWYGRIETHVPLNLAVNKDLRFWQDDETLPSSLPNDVAVSELYDYDWLQLSGRLPQMR